jgi:hypothetical protein
MSPNLNAELNNNALYSMFKGEAGTRKSSIALSYPTPQYWFSWDKKMRALLMPMKAMGMTPDMVDYDDYSDWDKPRKKLELLQSECKYKTIIIDSITSAADGILAQGKKLKSGASGKLVNNIQVNSIEDYNAEDAALSELVALTKDIHQFHKVNIILIAHVMEVTNKFLTGETHVSRTIVTAGKRISIKIPAYCEEVYHFDIETGFDPSIGGDYKLITSHTGDDFARSSLPLPRVIKFSKSKNFYNEFIIPGIEQLKQDLITTPLISIPTK